MRYPVALALALGGALAGCGDVQRQIAADYQCRLQAPPEPDSEAILFGLLGTAAKMADPDWRAWAHDLDQCKRERLASAP